MGKGKNSCALRKQSGKKSPTLTLPHMGRERASPSQREGVRGRGNDYRIYFLTCKGFSKVLNVAAISNRALMPARLEIAATSVIAATLEKPCP
jgi:hypothetical protein